MEQAVVQKMRTKIARSKYGEVFMVSSFPKFNVEYVTKLLAVFEKEGIITRISKGIYVKAQKTQFGILYPTAAEIVAEVAKRDHAMILPTGETAENMLGFSTQVPMKSCFLTSGTTRDLKLGNRTVTLKYGVPRNFAFKGKLMPILVQALKSIGEKNITEDDCKRVRLLLSETPETATFEHDILLAPVWIRQLIMNNKQQDSDE